MKKKHWFKYAVMFLYRKEGKFIRQIKIKTPKTSKGRRRIINLVMHGKMCLSPANLSNYAKMQYLGSFPNKPSLYKRF